jgi:hypothetical protein
MKRIVTKVDIHVSDDGGECDPTCPFLNVVTDHIAGCIAFHKRLEGRNRCIGCMAREDVTYQVPVVEE